MLRKKFFHSFLAVALLAGTACSVTSCKDTDEDLYLQLKDENKDLSDQIEALRQLISNCQGNCETNIMTKVTQLLEGYQPKGDYVTQTELTQKLSNFITAQWLIDNNYLTKTEIINLIEGYKYLTEADVNKILEDKGYLTGSDLANYVTKEDLDDYAKKSDLTGLITPEELERILGEKGYLTKDDLSNYYTKAETDSAIQKALEGYATMQWVIDQGYLTKADLEGYMKTADLDAAIAKYLTDNGYVNDGNLADKINNLIKGTDSEFNNLTEVLTRIKAAEQNITNLQTSINLINEALANKADKSDLDKKADQEALDNLEKRVKALEDTVVELSNKIDAINGRLNKFITSIIAQATYNNLTGTLSLPFGIRSTILMSYYGVVESSTKEFTFPGMSTMPEYNNEYVITEQDLARLGTIEGQLTFNNGDKMNNDNLGYLYMTLNPTSVNFEGVSFSLESSDGNVSPVKIVNAQKSDDLLSFGFTRADNGFYRAEAQVDEDAYDQIRINVEPGLKSAISDAVHNRTASDFAHLAKVVYNQFNGFLPALALKASWEWTDEKGVSHPESIYSNYDIAATSFRPLSYKFLYDQSLPQIPALPDFGDLTFNLSVPTFELGSFSFSIDTPELNFDFEFDNANVEVHLNDVTITIPDFPIGGYVDPNDPNHIIFEYGSRTFEHVNFENIAQVINDAVDSEIDKILNDLKKKLTDTIKNEIERGLSELTASIQKNIDDFIAQIETKVNENLQDIITDLNNQINSKINKVTDRMKNYLDKVQRVINAINARLKQPNLYMQPILLYNAGNGYHRLSNSMALPSQIVLAGGDAMTLYPTSYNAEIITPAFKKFVAVTNVCKNGESFDPDMNSGECMDVLKAANNTEAGLNTVLPGQARSVGLTLKAGYTYEIVYSAIDYHGYTSTHKYYVTVK